MIIGDDDSPEMVWTACWACGALIRVPADSEPPFYCEELDGKHVD